MRRYTPEEISFLTAAVVGRSKEETAALFNTHFGSDLTPAQIKSFCGNRRLRCGRDGRFKPGHAPWNKGMQGRNGFSETRFKPGNRPQTWRPVGSERISKDGLIEVKVKEPCTWMPKQRALYEAEHGPLPKGHVVIFADRNTRNFALENLIAVSRGELVLLNKFRLIAPRAEVTRSGVLISRLMATTSRRAKNKDRKEIP